MKRTFMSSLLLNESANGGSSAQTISSSEDPCRLSLKNVIQALFRVVDSSGCRLDALDKIFYALFLELS